MEKNISHFFSATVWNKMINLQKKKIMAADCNKQFFLLTKYFSQMKLYDCFEIFFPSHLSNI